tara:strand:+ start:421 stop:1770 length:1350 start_codon:yes stop_codon:yes gene_type:complete
MVKKAQDIQAAYEVEGNQYGNPPDSTLYHLGLLDTFDPRAVAMNVTPVPSIGQSTDAHHAAGPIDVTLPLKVALQGDGWKELLGNAIGRTHVDADETSTGTGAPGGDGIDAVHALTTDVYSHAILAKDLSTTQHTLCTGVVVNEATLEADYTAGGYITLDCACTALYSEDDDDGDFTFNQNDAYNGVAFPSAPTADPLLPTDMTLSYSVSTTANALAITDTAGNYIEVGERYMRFFDETDALDSGYSAGGPIVAEGVIDLDHSDYDSNGMDALKTDINAIATSCTTGTSSTDPQNLLKGIYKMTAGAVNIPAVTDTDQTLTEISNLKTVSLKIANNNTPIPGKVDGKWVQNSKIARGKADITLDITATAQDETLYDIYRGETNGGVIPLMRLDFGTNGSIALTNGTITSFSRPLTGGGEVVDTLSIKFRGNGDYRNYSAFAISADLTLQ